MRTFFLLVGLAFCHLAPARAQDLSIERLTNLTELRDGQAAEMDQWTFRPDTPQGLEERLTWAWWPGGAVSPGPPPVQLSLRAATQGYDVVLYLQRLPIYNQLRRELERQRLVPVPVTCLGANCLGQRFTTGTCTVAFYEGKPGDYPFVVVMQPLAGHQPLPVIPTGPAKVVKLKIKPAPVPAAPAAVNASAIR